MIILRKMIFPMKTTSEKLSRRNLLTALILQSIRGVFWSDKNWQVINDDIDSILFFCPCVFSIHEMCESFRSKKTFRNTIMLSANERKTVEELVM